MLLDREIRTQLLEAARHFPVIVLTGARQAGKTTALRAIFSGYSYVSLDLPSQAEQAERDPESFLSAFPAPVIIDEVQYAPGLFRHVKAVVDRDRHACGRYILTGSQQFTLMKSVSESLAGRAAVFELENLSLAELSVADTFVAGQPGASAGSVLKSVLVRGQFPELWRNPELPSHIFYSSYLATYLERDVRQILNVTSLRDFERFIRVLAARSGSVLNKSDVAKDVGVSVKAIGDWISVLQASGQILLLEPWFSNFGKRIARSPKLYFRDTGLLAFLLGIDAVNLESSPFLGALWETFLCAQMRKTAAYRDGSARLWYYRDQYAREVDFVIEHRGTLSFAEAKWTELPDASDARTVRAVHQELADSGSPWQAGNRYILCRTANPYPLADGTLALGPSLINGMTEFSKNID